MLKTYIQYTCILALSTSLLTGCATSNLLKKNKAYTKQIEVNLVEDQVIAFGRPAKTDAHLPADSVVIAGKKHNYILTKGGAKFIKLISSLDPQYIQLNTELKFFSENNDGRFSGKLPLNYVVLSEKVTREDIALFVQNGAEECSTGSDTRMQTQRFCFKIPLEGLVYPVANNLSSLQPLSKPYQVSIYTKQLQTVTSHQSSQAFETAMLFPFAIAIDVISLPFIAVDRILEH